MKILKGFLSILLGVALIALTVLFIFFQSFDADQYLLKISQKIGKIIGRPVTVGHAAIGLSSSGITVDVGPVMIADDPKFTSQAFITIDRIRIVPDLKTLVLRHEINVRGLIIQSPQVHLIRSMQGVFNISSLKQIEGTPVEIKKSQVGIGPSQSIPVGNAVIHQVQGVEQIIHRIKIQDATVSVIDQNETLPLDLWFHGINISIKDAQLTKPFLFFAKASFYSPTPNVQAQAQLTIDPYNKSFSVDDLSFETDLTGLDREKIKFITPDIQRNLILNNSLGKIDAHVAHGEFVSGGILDAKGDLNIHQAVFKNFNIIRTLLDRTLNSFGLQGAVDNLLGGGLKDKLGNPDTVIESAEAQFSYHDKTLSLEDSSVQTNIFEMTAKGSMDAGQNLNLDTMLFLNPDVSKAFVDEFKGFEVLMDDSQRITIPARLTGIIPHLAYKPTKDFRKKSKKALMAEGGNILGVLLGGGTNTPADSQDPQDTGKKHKMKFGNIIKAFLN